MPMPPPRASSEGRPDRHIEHEIGQLVRALAENGPLAPAELARLVGAAYWEPGRFDRALGFAVADGVVHRSSEGTVATSRTSA